MFGVKAFGTPAAAAPAFGQGPGLFGTPAAAPAFGQAPAAAPLFGQPAAAPAAGAFAFPAAAAPAFGATGVFGAAAPAAAPSPYAGFGAVNTPSPGGVFGQPAAAAPSPFGVGGGLFGTPAPANPFGAPKPAATGFGAAPQAGAFGFAASPAAGGMFGAPAQQQATNPYGPPAPVGGVPTTDAAVKEITDVRNAYIPTSATFKFNHLFLNVVDNPAQRVKPANVDEMRWRQALAQAGGPNNPDRLWPVLATGFRDLRLRSQAQQQASLENGQQLSRMSDQAQRLSQRHTQELRARSLAAQQRHVALSDRLLKVCRSVDALEGRMASTLGYRGDLARAKEQEVSRQLSQVDGVLGPASTGAGLQRRLEAVAAAARLRVGAPPDAGGQARLDERSVAQLFAILQEHAVAAKHLQAVLRRDQGDVDIMAAAQLDDGRGPMMF